MQETDDDTGLAGHGGMGSVAGEKVAEQGIFTVRGAAADLVARVEVAQDNRNALRFEISLDALAQEQTNVFQLHIAGGIALTGVGSQQLLTSALRDGDDGVRFFEHPLLQRRRETV